MVPRAALNAWAQRAPWPNDVDVEQDLILSRAIIDPVDVERNLEPKLSHAGSRRDLDRLLRELPPGSTRELGVAAVRDRIAGC